MATTPNKMPFMQRAKAAAPMGPEETAPMESEAAGDPGEVDGEAEPHEGGDVGKIIASIQVPPNLKAIFDKAVLSGMRIMFDKNSHEMMRQQMDKPGPLPQKMAEGITTLIYMLWTQSNQTLPPQIIAPLTVVLTLKAFEFLQKSGDPEATPQAMGECVDATIDMVMGKFGVQRDQVAQMIGQGNQPSMMDRAKAAQQPAVGAMQ